MNGSFPFAMRMSFASFKHIQLTHLGGFRVPSQFEKPGGSPLSRERLQECTALAKKQAKKVMKMIELAAPIKDKI